MPTPRSSRLIPLLMLVLALGLAAGGTEAQAPGSTDPPTQGVSAPAAAALPLSREEAVALALSNSLQLQSLDTGVEIQDYRRSAGWLDNPEVRVSNLSTRSAHERFDELEIGVRWRPPAPGEAAVERQQGRVLLWEQKVEARRARDWLASRVRRACADVVMYRELVSIASQRVDNETKRIGQIEAMVAVGRRSVVYYTKARVMVSEARSEHTRSLQALLEEERRLQRLTGAASRIDVLDEPWPEVASVKEALLALAYAHRPEVQLVEARQRLAVKRHDRQRWRRLPQLSYVEASRHREAEAGDWHQLMLGVEIPLFGRNGGRTRAASLEIARKETQSLAIRERLEDEIDDALAVYGEARLAWRLTREDGGQLIEEASRVIADATERGTIPADEVLELERAIMDTRVVMARQRRELAHAICSLWYVLGIEGPDPAALPPPD